MKTELMRNERTTIHKDFIHNEYENCKFLRLQAQYNIKMTEHIR